MKQPALGITATVLVMAIALGFVSLFSFPTFAGWVGYLLLCTIPVMMIHGMCCTGDVWEHFRQFFEGRGTRVYTPTLRPHVRGNIAERPHADLCDLGFREYIAE